MTNDPLREAYNGMAKEYLETRTSDGPTGWQNREIERPIMFSLVPQNLSGMKLLDIGCGPGIHVQEYTTRGAQIYGIDLSDEMITLAQERCNGEFKQGSITKLPYDDNSFDIVTSSFVLDHVKDYDKAVQEIKRVLKDGCCAYISVPHPMIFMHRERSLQPTHAYFDSEPVYLPIAVPGAQCIDYPRTMQELLNPFIEHGFTLTKLVENTPDVVWKDKYGERAELAMTIPLLCHMIWQK